MFFIDLSANAAIVKEGLHAAMEPPKPLPITTALTRSV